MRGSRFEYDLALMLTRLAWTRGLFSSYESLEEVLSADETYLRTNSGINKQPVFALSTTRETKAMMNGVSLAVPHSLDIIEA
jgi:hypothetical protein